MIESRDIHWLAGLLEGEGTFYRYKWKGRKTYVSPRISVCSTDKDIIDRVSSIMDTRTYGPYKYGDNKKPWWKTETTKSTGVGWMMTLYSLMGERRKAKIAEILAEWRTNAA